MPHMHSDLKGRGGMNDLMSKFCFVRKVCNEYSVLIFLFLLLQYAPTDYLARGNLLPKKIVNLL